MTSVLSTFILIRNFILFAIYCLGSITFMICSKQLTVPCHVIISMLTLPWCWCLCYMMYIISYRDGDGDYRFSLSQFLQCKSLHCTLLYWTCIKMMSTSSSLELTSHRALMNAMLEHAVCHRAKIILLYTQNICYSSQTKEELINW